MGTDDDKIGNTDLLGFDDSEDTPSVEQPEDIGPDHPPDKDYKIAVVKAQNRALALQQENTDLKRENQRLRRLVERRGEQVLKLGKEIARLRATKED